MSNRDIKFRAWDAGSAQMHYPTNSTHLALFDGKGVVPWRIYYNAGGHMACDSQYGGVLMQFTGLKDKNGREIYEGDIVRLWHRGEDEDGNDTGFATTGVVEWSSGCFWINGSGYAVLQHFHYNDSDREVLGNIHENPELLPV